MGLKMNTFTGSIALLVLPIMAFAEVVVTTDGRTIDLKDDGTYVFIVDAPSKQISLKEGEPFLQHNAGKYGNNSMRFMPIFLNETGETVVGFRFTSTFRSAFGDEIFSFDGESSEKIPLEASSTSKTFYFFEDNQFIANQPYDKLKIFESSGTGKIETKITAVVFENGDVVTAN